MNAGNRKINGREGEVEWRFYSRNSRKRRREWLEGQEAKYGRIMNEVNVCEKEKVRENSRKGLDDILAEEQSTTYTNYCAGRRRGGGEIDSGDVSECNGTKHERAKLDEMDEGKRAGAKRTKAIRNFLSKLSCETSKTKQGLLLVHSPATSIPLTKAPPPKGMEDSKPVKQGPTLKLKVPPRTSSSSSSSSQVKSPHLSSSAQALPSSQTGHKKCQLQPHYCFPLTLIPLHSRPRVSNPKHMAHFDETRGAHEQPNATVPPPKSSVRKMNSVKSYAPPRADMSKPLPAFPRHESSTLVGDGDGSTKAKARLLELRNKDGNTKSVLPPLSERTENFCAEAYMEPLLPKLEATINPSGECEDRGAKNEVGEDEELQGLRRLCAARLDFVAMEAEIQVREQIKKRREKEVNHESTNSPALGPTSRPLEKLRCLERGKVKKETVDKSKDCKAGNNIPKQITTVNEHLENKTGEKTKNSRPAIRSPDRFPGPGPAHQQTHEIPIRPQPLPFIKETRIPQPSLPLSHSRRLLRRKPIITRIPLPQTLPVQHPSSALTPIPRLRSAETLSKTPPPYDKLKVIQRPVRMLENTVKPGR